MKKSNLFFKKLFFAVAVFLIAAVFYGCSQKPAQEEQPPAERFPAIVSDQPVQWKDETLKRLVYDALMRDYSEDVYPYELENIEYLFILGDKKLNFGEKPFDCGVTEDGSGFHYKGIMKLDGTYQTVDHVFTESVSICLDDLRYFTSLRALHIYLVNPTDLAVLEHLPALKQIFAGICDLSDLTGIDKCTDLMSAYLDYCNISDLSPLTKISPIHLSLKGNKLKDISPLADMPQLPNDLILSYNNISDISALSPQGRRTGLGYLNLRNNNITDISPLAEYTGIGILSLTYNKISDVSPLAGLSKQDSVIYLGGNPVENIEVLKGFYSVYTAP